MGYDDIKFQIFIDSSDETGDTFLLTPCVGQRIVGSIPLDKQELRNLLDVLNHFFSEKG